ncbi:hypothetical protein E2562_024239 [Oryza meyeriana var. granulata]|uniref:Uncharacterized protein n=1 Tax=Oryza meyeriana var. granulata TaxID=110450 RepID=A0A6G1E012_9ORYZ|nr:hypothetical protein E2562_024239 [Oryza meyeriana var. granulata]
MPPLTPAQLSSLSLSSFALPRRSAQHFPNPPPTVCEQLHTVPPLGPSDRRPPFLPTAGNRPAPPPLGAQASPPVRHRHPLWTAGETPLPTKTIRAKERGRYSSPIGLRSSH